MFVCEVCGWDSKCDSAPKNKSKENNSARSSSTRSYENLSLTIRTSPKEPHQHNEAIMSLQADELTHLTENNTTNQNNTSRLGIASSISTLLATSMNSKIYIASAFILFVAFCTSLVYIQEKNSNTELAELSELGKKKGGARDHSYDCLTDEKYSKHTAKTAFELPIAALFKDTKGEKKFEASSIINVDDTYYAICDNSWAISKFSSSLTPFSEDNIMIGDPNRETEDSGYEAIFHNNGTFYVVRESVEHWNADATNSTYHAIIEELVLEGDDYEIKDQCSCEFEFEGDR